MPIIQVSIEVFNIRIEEPVTTLTDILIAAMCFYSFIRLKVKSGKQHVYHYLRFFFLFLGTGTLLGGLAGHGFLYFFPSYWKFSGWVACMISVAVFEQASLILAGRYYKRRMIRMLTWQNIVVLIIFTVLMCLTGDFLFILLYMIFSMMFVVGGIHLIVYTKSKSRGSLWCLVALGTSFIAALVFILPWNLDTWFNKIDLSHLIIGLSIYFFYRAAGNMIMESVIKGDPGYNAYI